jgi:hypothetical protein
MIIDIEEKLDNGNTSEHFAREASQWEVRQRNSREEDEEDGAGDEGFIGSPGQIFRNTLMSQLLRYQL